jgi:hypothetical protein
MDALASTVTPAMILSDRLLTMFNHIAGLCRNPGGFCYAYLRYLSDCIGRDPSTVRRQVSELIALGMIRKERSPGGRNLLFISEPSAWKLPNCRAKSEQGLPIGDSRTPSPKHNKQQIRTASKPLPLVEPLPVVVLSATPPEILESDEQEDLSAFRAYLESEEGTNADAALGGVETLDALADTAVASLALVVSPARTERALPDSVPTIKASPKPPLSPITPDQRSTVEQLVAAGVTRSTAAQAVQQDPARAEAALRAFLAYQQRKPIDCPTALYRVAFREAWKPTARQERTATATPVYAHQLGLVVTSPSPPRPIATDPQSGGAGRSVVMALRQKGFGSKFSTA